MRSRQRKLASDTYITLYILLYGKKYIFRFDRFHDRTVIGSTYSFWPTFHSHTSKGFFIRILNLEGKDSRVSNFFYLEKFSYCFLNFIIPSTEITFLVCSCVLIYIFRYLIPSYKDKINVLPCHYKGYN